MTDQLRPGQRLIVYASLKVKKSKNQDEKPPYPNWFETWLWNLSQKQFDKAMKWSPE